MSDEAFHWMEIRSSSCNVLSCFRCSQLLFVIWLMGSFDSQQLETFFDGLYVIFPHFDENRELNMRDPWAMVDQT